MSNKYINAIMGIPSEKKKKNRDFGYPGAYDGVMVKTRLKTIKRMARILDAAIQNGDTIPRWCTDLIATSEDRLVMVTDYMLSTIESREGRK